MALLRLGIYDGARQPFPLPADLLVRVLENATVVHNQDHFTNIITIPVEPKDTAHYAVNLACKGYRSPGYSGLTIRDQGTTYLDVMVVRKDPGFRFGSARWELARAAYPFLGPDDQPTADTYTNLMENEPAALACLLNINAAMSQIPLYGSLTPLAYMRQVRWDEGFAPRRDRFFAWCDAELRDQISSGASSGCFDEERAPWIKHPGATESWKENAFGEANVQFTFHGNTRRPEFDNQIMIELDIDYYKNTLNHLVLEVLFNDLGGMTDPIQVYLLRWIASRAHGRPDFQPLYTLAT